MYLVTCTRPDLAHTVSFLSQFSSHPLPIHHTAVKRVFRYLNSTRHYKLSYPRNGTQELIGYTDSDYANDRSTRRSYSGYVFYLGNCPISWMLKKQQSVATSTTEAEYMVLSLAARQAIWYMHGFQQLKLTIPIYLKCDNTSGIKLAKNPILHQRSKHIDVHYHFSREHLLAKHFMLSYVSSKENIADIMTKGLDRELHQKFTQQLLLTNT